MLQAEEAQRLRAAAAELAKRKDLLSKQWRAAIK